MRSDRAVTIETGVPGVSELEQAVGALRGWQAEGSPFQLHPGDVGWFWRFGAEAAAAAVRTWRRDGEIVAVGLLDGATMLRLGIAPDAQQDEELARAVVADLARPARGVLGPGEAYVESPNSSAVHRLLGQEGWSTDAAWTPLCRDLSEPVKAPDVRVEVVGPEQVPVRVALHRAAFDGSAFTEERWHAMASGSPYADARCLVAYDDQDRSVAAVTVWSAGPGRPGVLEPMGVPREHRGHGYGTAICVAAAAALQDLGSSSATVCTPSSNVGGVATYVAAGYQPLPERLDRARDA